MRIQKVKDFFFVYSSLGIIGVGFTIKEALNHYFNKLNLFLTSDCPTCNVLDVIIEIC